MKNRKYHIVEAHSGTSQKEVEKAKRQLREVIRKGKNYNDSDNITFIFEDINSQIWAEVIDENHEFICDILLISDGTR